MSTFSGHERSSVRGDFLFPVIVAFQCLTVGLYLFGPVCFGDEPPSLGVALLVLIYIAALALGWHSAKSITLQVPGRKFSPAQFVVMAIIVGLLLLPATLFIRSGFESGLSVGEIYVNSEERRGEMLTPIEYVRLFFGVFIFGLFPVLLVFWRELTRRVAVVGVVVVFISLAIGIFSGVNKPLFDVAIIMVGLYAAGVWVPRFRWGERIVVAIVVCIFFIGIATFFVEGQLTRYGSPVVGGYDKKTETSYKYSGDDALPLVFYSALSAYLVQGYRAMDLALNEDFDFSWGVGNSIFLSRQVDRFAGTSLQDSTYPAKIENHGWDRYVNWSSFYTWWASDLHFVGVSVLMFFIGRIFRLIRNSLYRERRVSTVILYAYLILGLFYLPANNQLLQSGETAISFLFLLLFVLTRGWIVGKNKCQPLK